MWVSAHCGFHLPPQRHPFAVNLVMFSANSLLFPTHKQAHSEGLIAAKLSQEKKKKKVWGRKIFGCPPAH